MKIENALAVPDRFPILAPREMCPCLSVPDRFPSVPAPSVPACVCLHTRTGSRSGRKPIEDCDSQCCEQRFQDHEGPSTVGRGSSNLRPQCNRATCQTLRGGDELMTSQLGGLPPGSQPAADRPPAWLEWLEEAILTRLRRNKRPQSGRSLASALLRCARGDVGLVARYLAQRGRIVRQRGGWVLLPGIDHRVAMDRSTTREPRSRCTANAEDGKRCLRLAVPETESCSYHQASLEPTYYWFRPEDLHKQTCQRYVIRQAVLDAAVAAGVMEPEQKPVYLRDAVLIVDGVEGRYCHSQLWLGRDCRTWLQRHEPEWLAQFDAGEVETVDPYRDMLRRCVAARPWDYVASNRSVAAHPEHFGAERAARSQRWLDEHADLAAMSDPELQLN